jgi:hypothetical protein
MDLAISTLQEMGDHHDALVRLLQDSGEALDRFLTMLRRQEGRNFLSVEGQPPQDNAYRAALVAVQAVYHEVRDAFRPTGTVTSDSVRAVEFFCWGGQLNCLLRKHPDDPYDYEFLRKHFDVLCERFTDHGLPDFEALRCEARGELASALYAVDRADFTGADRSPSSGCAPNHALLGSARHHFIVPASDEKFGPFVAFVRPRPGVSIEHEAVAQAVYFLGLECLSPGTFKSYIPGQSPVEALNTLDGADGTILEWMYVAHLDRLRAYQRAASAVAACLTDAKLLDGEAVSDASLRGQVYAKADRCDLWTNFAYRQLRRSGLLRNTDVLDGKASVWWYPGDAFAASLAAICLAGAPAPPAGLGEERDGENSIRLEGEIWHLRYGEESGRYPASDNQSIGWLVKLLAKPGHRFTVAELRGDPEGKLHADSAMRGERLTDAEGLKRIRDRLQDIDEISNDTGGLTQSLEEERARLLQELKEGKEGKQAQTALRKDHHNIATQFRNLREKLVKGMPQLAAHLKSSLNLDFPHFCYNPPPGTPAWKT